MRPGQLSAWPRPRATGRRNAAVSARPCGVGALGFVLLDGRRTPRRNRTAPWRRSPVHARQTHPAGNQMLRRAKNRHRRRRRIYLCTPEVKGSSDVGRGGGGGAHTYTRYKIRYGGRQGREWGGEAHSRSKMHFAPPPPSKSV